jgi:hypothetical protein
VAFGAGSHACMRHVFGGLELGCVVSACDMRFGRAHRSCDVNVMSKVLAVSGAPTLPPRQKEC